MARIVKTFSKKTEDEIARGGLSAYVSFEKLKEYFSIDVNLKPDETIEGIIIDDSIITVRVGKKEEQ